MFERYEYVCSEERRKDMLRQADKDRLAIRARRSAFKNSCRSQMREELSAMMTHAGRFLKLLIRVGIPSKSKEIVI